MGGKRRLITIKVCAKCGKEYKGLWHTKNCPCGGVLIKKTVIK